MIGGKDITKYYAGLTGEPFLFSETRTLASFISMGEDIEHLRLRNLEENLVMHKKVGSLKRVSTPIFRRLSVVSPESLQILTGSNLENARIILLVSIAKTDRVVRDFILNIYADKLAIKASMLTKSDIERYFDSIYEEEPLIRDRSEQTKAKLKQQLMKIMTEAGLVIKRGTSFEITRPHITTKLANQLTIDGDTVYLKVLGGA